MKIKIEFEIDATAEEIITLRDVATSDDVNELRDSMKEFLNMGKDADEAIERAHQIGKEADARLDELIASHNKNIAEINEVHAQTMEGFSKIGATNAKPETSPKSDEQEKIISAPECPIGAFEKYGVTNEKSAKQPTEEFADRLTEETAVENTFYTNIQKFYCILDHLSQEERQIIKWGVENYPCIEII